MPAMFMTHPLTQMVLTSGMIDQPIIKAHYSSADIAVDDFDSAEWDQAEAVQIDHYWSGTRASHDRQAETRILWSNNALHIRFVCQQNEPLIVSNNPQTEKKTMGLWDRDVCEIFIAPDPNVVERYFELEAAPTGEWLDVAIKWTPEKRESDWEFDSHMTTAVQIGASHIITAMRIPWSESIPQPQKGDRWRVNLFRCVGKDPNRAYLAWRPTRTPQPSFHLPSAFGWLQFA